MNNSAEQEKKVRYAQVGTGGRARMYYEALCSEYKDSCEMVGFCDQSQTRMNYANRMIKEKFGHAPVPSYDYTDFEAMIKEQKPDVIIVTTVDRTHDDYIVRAMEMGCDVVTEKPMTTDEIPSHSCNKILDVRKGTSCLPLRHDGVDHRPANRTDRRQSIADTALRHGKPGLPLIDIRRHTKWSSNEQWRYRS